MSANPELVRRAVHVAIAAACAAGFWFIPDLRRDFIRDLVSIDAAPGGPEPELAPAPPGSAGLARADHVRVVLVDGADPRTARTMPAWDELCGRGLDLVVDVGFPTVSLPVQLALWSGLTQQQTGVLYHAGKPLARPLPGTIPSQVSDSIAIAESHPEIIGSIGFARAEPPLGKLPAGWDTDWIARAIDATTSPTRLVFIHILGVDAAGHRNGPASAAWRAAAATADGVLSRLVAAGRDAHPEALWLVLADHGHIATGGHGGEERGVRQVRACLAGPQVAPGRGGPIHLVDIARALADALDVLLAPGAAGRPLAGALARPLEDDDAVPSLPLGHGVLSLLIMIVGVAITAWGMQGRYALGPWWFPAAALLLVLVCGVPTLSTPMIYKPLGRDMYLAFMPALVLLAAGAGLGLRRVPSARVVAAQLALPLAALAALLTATGAWPIVFGGDAAPVVPRWTGWTSPTLLIVAQGLGVVAIALLATAVLPGSGRGEPRETARSGPEAPE
jgi:hypothetical protein